MNIYKILKLAQSIKERHLSDDPNAKFKIAIDYYLSVDRKREVILLQEMLKNNYFYLEKEWWDNRVNLNNLDNATFVDDFIEENDWYFISDGVPLSESFLDVFQNEVRWDLVSEHQKLSEDFIRKFEDKINWERLSFSEWNDEGPITVLSEDFIREFQDKLNWNGISRYQRLSESFIEEFKDRVDWTAIFFSQKLSEDFIRKFKHRYWPAFINNRGRRLH